MFSYIYNSPYLLLYIWENENDWNSDLSKHRKGNWIKIVRLGPYRTSKCLWKKMNNVTIVISLQGYLSVFYTYRVLRDHRALPEIFSAIHSTQDHQSKSLIELILLTAFSALISNKMYRILNMGTLRAVIALRWKNEVLVAFFYEFGRDNERAKRWWWR